MKNPILTAALSAFALSTASAAPVLSDARWFDDYDAAVAVAKEEGKDLFVDFSGSDWCHYCIKLEKEVLTHDAWIDAASKEFVLVMLDFPRGDEAKAKVPNPKRNQQLAQELNVEGFPSVFLMTVDGVVFAQTGYQPGGPEEYVAHMAEIAEVGREAMAPYVQAAAAFTAAEGAEAQWAAWDQLALVFSEMSSESPFVRTLEKHVRWGFDTDADNAAGKKSVAAKALLGKGITDDAVLEFAKENDPKNEQGMLELVVSAQFGTVRDDAAAKAAIAALEGINGLGFQNKDVGFMLNLTVARWYDGPLANAEEKVAFAKKAMEIGSNDAELMAALKKLIG